MGASPPGTPGAAGEYRFEVRYNGSLGAQEAGGPVGREAVLDGADYMAAVYETWSGSADVDDIHEIELELGAVTDAFRDADGAVAEVFDANAFYSQQYVESGGAYPAFQSVKDGAGTRLFGGFADITFDAGDDLAYRMVARDDTGTVIDRMDDWTYLDTVAEPDAFDEADRVAQIFRKGLGGGDTPTPDILEGDTVADANDSYESRVERPNGGDVPRTREKLEQQMEGDGLQGLLDRLLPGRGND